MSNFHDQFRPDPQYPEWRYWTTAKPIFQRADVHVVPPDEGDPKLQHDVEVMLICDYGSEASGHQEQAWNFLIDNAAAVEASLRRKLMFHHLKGYRGFVDELVPDFDENELEDWDQIKDSVPWETPAAIDFLYELCGISLYDHGLDECGFSCFEFNCGWDEEHGISVLMHRDHVLAASGISDFTNRGDELIRTAQAIQTYQFEEGDFSLLDWPET